MKFSFLSVGLLTLLSCHSIRLQLTSEELQKIRFDLSQLDEQGLRGPQDGKVALDYEFCIPREEQYRKEVESIDPSLKAHTA